MSEDTVSQNKMQELLDLLGPGPTGDEKLQSIVSENPHLSNVAEILLEARASLKDLLFGESPLRKILKPVLMTDEEVRGK